MFKIEKAEHPRSGLSVRNEESLMEVIEDNHLSGNPSDHIKVAIAIISR